MSANINPIFTITPVVAIASISTANTNRDGSGTLATLLTGGANGTRIEEVRIKGTGTTTAGMIRLFVDNLSDKRLIKEIVVTAITASASVAAFEGTWVPDVPFVLPSGYILKASTHNGETFHAAVIGGEF